MDGAERLKFQPVFLGTYVYGGSGTKGQSCIVLLEPYEYNRLKLFQDLQVRSDRGGRRLR